MSTDGLDANKCCLKCSRRSGDDWSQCVRSCPVSCSPHYESLDTEYEFHAWPPDRVGGQHLNRSGAGVLVLHKRTGLGVVSTAHRSMLMNKATALGTLWQLVDQRDRHTIESEFLAKFPPNENDIPF